MRQAFGKVVWWGVVGAGLWLSGGCGPSARPLIVEVRDGTTKSAVVGVGVEAASQGLSLSPKPGDLVDQVMGKRAVHLASGMTDASGRVTLEYVPERNVRLRVIGDGRTAFVIVTPGEIGGEEWMVMTDSPGAAATEVRVGTDDVR